MILTGEYYQLPSEVYEPDDREEAPSKEILDEEKLTDDEIEEILEEDRRRAEERYEREQQKKEPVHPVTSEKRNYQCKLWDLPKGGVKTRYKWNIEAIKALKQIEEEERLATKEEQEILSRYVGWGGLSGAFDERNDTWSKEYHELKGLLTPEEYESARATVNNAFYTSPEIVSCMYDALLRFGFRNGNILEPSMGIGNFFGGMPVSLRTCNLYGVEIDSISGRIARQLYQKADISIGGFEETKYPDNFFDVVIGNVPFGDYKVYDVKYNKLNFRIHDYFIAKALDQVRPGGIIAFITTKGTLDKSVTAKTDIYNQTGEYPYEAELISGASLTAGTVNLKGGTFVDGLHVMLDEGLNLTNILDEGRGYYGIDSQAIPVGSGTVQLNQTVMVEIPAKLGDISTSGNSKTTYGQSCTIGVTIEKDTTVYNYTYQWYDASGKIKGATSAEYTVPSNQAAGDYNYFCRVTATRKDNGLSETKDSGAIRVTVSKAEQPTHQHAYKEHVTKATTKAAGKIVVQCECGKIKSTTVIKKIKTVKLSEGTVTFNGKKKSPSVIVKDSSGKKLAKGKDYKVTLPNGRINAGIYTYKITFTGNYKGTKSIKLTIRPKAVTLNTVKASKKAVTVKWKKASKAQTTGYQVMVATNKNFTKSKKLITIKGYKNTSKKMTKAYYTQTITIQNMVALCHANPL